MLVLTRTVGERICIGDDIIIELLDCRISSGLIGIEAPRQIRIVRGEALLKHKPRTGHLRRSQNSGNGHAS